MTMIVRKLFPLLVSLFAVMPVVASEMAVGKDAYRYCKYISGGDTLLYRELIPEENAKGQYPLVVFLHGAGERGCDNEKQLTHGAQMFLNPANREKFPAYVVFPQCPEGDGWAYDEDGMSSCYPDSMPIVSQPRKWVRIVYELVKDRLNSGCVDANRVYLIGLSMGGMAVFDMAERYPDVWAAVVPICGSVNPKMIDKSRKVKFRIFHGDADAVVPVEGSRKAYLRLKKLGAEVEYVEFPGCTHGSWNPAFNLPDFMQWLFSKTK